MTSRSAQGAAGLRLVGGTLEVLDAAGTPRLRVAPPYIVGADGASTDATLAVTGCAVDTNPAPPWGRAVTAPGARVCQVKVSWPGSGVAYPAILDPRWTTTGSMGTARQDHTHDAARDGEGAGDRRPQHDRHHGPRDRGAVRPDDRHVVARRRA